MSYTLFPRKPKPPSEGNDPADHEVSVHVKALQVFKNDAILMAFALLSARSLDTDSELVSPEPGRRTAEIKCINKPTISDIIKSSELSSDDDDEEEKKNEGPSTGPKPAMQTKVLRCGQEPNEEAQWRPQRGECKGRRQGGRQGGQAGSSHHVRVGGGAAAQGRLAEDEDLGQDGNYDNLFQTMKHAATNEHDRLHATWCEILD
ncbi:hypothetical protein V8E36_003655 [Tilletia maclaganii]